ncbi:hypothetical protein [Kocuria carniphila]|uniref:hypothetical protein n=1 Tax=Kocuria carniphila TaxID=262208 RepID=UPI0028E91607|nr:hypothetical protein [Kocuria carniphila]
MRFLRSFVLPSAALSLGLVVSLAPAATAAPASPHIAEAPVVQVATANPPATTYFKPFSAHGMKSSYHIYTDGIDRSKPVGVMFYFGGDYWKTSETWVHNPGGSQLKAMASEARKKNMILVVPISPDKKTTGDGITWWEDIDKNGQYFRSLKDSLVNSYGLDTTRVWLAGYSGGAEFITYEVLADQQNWIRGGGATIIGGGGANGMQTAPNAAVRGLSITWHAGSKDVVGDTNPPEWSAKAAAAQGQKVYKNAGFGRAALHTLQGVDHYGYNQPALIGQDLKAVPNVSGTTAGTQTSSLLKGAIRTSYLNTGGSAKYGQPTSAERKTGFLRGVCQGFTRGYTYYWSPQTAAAPVKWSGAIGASFKNAGYERGWGYPAHAERSVTGGAYQDYRRGGVVNRAMWSPKTGARVVKMTGGVGAAWRAAGYERNWGYPVTNEYAVARGVQQKFSNGRVATWDRSTGRVTITRG